MEVVKRILLVLVSPIFITLLFTTAFVVGFVRTATHPATVKKLVADSGIYSTVADSVIKQAGNINTSLGTINIDNPIILSAAKQTISPQYIQQQAEPAIDNIYRWLDGKIPRPDFKIKLSAQKADFANRAAAVLEPQLAALPKCTTYQQVRDFNALDPACLPPGVSAQQAAEQVRQSLSASDYLDQADISAANLRQSVSCGSSTCPEIAVQRSVFDDPNVKNVPQKYQLAKKIPIILSILTVFAGLAVIFLSKTWQIGLRHAGFNLFIIGILMLALAWFLPGEIKSQLAPKLHLNSADIYIDLESVINDLARTIDKNYWFFGGLYSIIGAAAIAAGEYFRRRSGHGPAAKLPAAAVKKR